MQFYDFEFNRLLDVSEVISWRYTKYFGAMGTFQAKFHLSSPVTKLVMERDYLVCTFSGETVIITGKEIGNDLTIYGRSCDWLLKKRVVMPFNEVEKSTGDHIKELFEKAYLDCSDVTIGEVIQGGTKRFSQDGFKDLYSVVAKELGEENFGWEFVFDTLKCRWIFNVLNGRELNLIISEDCKNASKLSITDNISEFANYCYYNGGSKGSSESGLYRFETYVNSKEEAECDKKLEEGKKQWRTQLDAIGILYKKNYLLGDTVRVQIIKNELKITRRLRIRGVEMENSYLGYREKPIFEEV